MANKSTSSTKKSYRRGGSRHYAELGRQSAQSRIRRHITCEVMRDTSRVTSFPTRKRESDAGYDITSPERFTLKPGESHNVRTGLRVNCPKGYFYEVRGRSSNNLVAVEAMDNVIDATYTGEIVVVLTNNGNQPKTFAVGDRIAQLIFLPQIHVKFEPVKEFTLEPGARGDAGWGSSGN